MISTQSSPVILSVFVYHIAGIFSRVKYLRFSSTKEEIDLLLIFFPRLQYSTENNLFVMEAIHELLSKAIHQQVNYKKMVKLLQNVNVGAYFSVNIRL